PVFGYTAMVLSLITTGFLAFGLWVHHMFATNLPDLGKSFFTAASMLIAIPSAVQIFCWIATMWTGKLNFKTPFYFALAFFVNLWTSRRHGVLAGDNPWGAGTLEWATSSPPPAANFDAVPVVHGREPLWEAPAEPTLVRGLAVTQREVLVTTVLDAEPDHRIVFPTPTPWPFLSAVATTVLFVGSIFTPWAIVWASIPVGIALTMWFWPKPGETEREMALEKSP
ncbi:MAG TPA: cbb3-type cytochrome c oxidase subunit I, partial [Chloroflexota bacterium]|nr:cbb3-type cytochrome c oxidase subunit I [Chloroflexota bacterium]